MNRQKGFTLVELVATLVIIALVAVVSGPLFFNVSVFKQSGFFEETLAAVRYAQKHAVATGCTVRVQTTTTGFTLYRKAGTDASVCNTPTFDQPIADPSGSGATFTRTAPDGVSLDARDFTFAADGTASISTSITVGVPGGPTLQVVAATGYVGR